MISTPIKINVNIFPKDQINSHHADMIILTWRDAPCVAATDSFISVGGLCETKSICLNQHVQYSARQLLLQTYVQSKTTRS